MTQSFGDYENDYEDDYDDYPCLDEANCGLVCLGDCYAASYP